MTSVTAGFQEISVCVCVCVYDFMLLLPNSVSDGSYGSHFLGG